VGKIVSPIEVTTVSPQLQQVLNEARQLSPQERLELVHQLSDGDRDGTLSWAEKLVQMEQQALESGQVERVEGGLVVKSQSGEVLDLDLVELINQQREERAQTVMGGILEPIFKLESWNLLKVFAVSG
jgi:hypothetical protein